MVCLTPHQFRPTRLYQGMLLVYHTSDKKPASALRNSDGNSNYIVTNHIYSQINKSLGSAGSQGFCCCSGQLASEKPRQQYATSKHTQWVECSTLWRSRLPRYTYLDEIQVAYHHIGGAEYVLSVVSRPKVKSRQRAGSRSGKKHLRPGHTSWALPELY